MRGQYDRMAGAHTSSNPTCNNKSIYKKSGGDYYLFLPDGHSDWVVGTTADMNACRSTGYLNMKGNCASDPTGCVGRWVAATGTDATGRFGDYNDCEGTWCDDPNVRVH